MILPDCTILIPTRNRAKELEETVRLLCERGLSDTPVIVVDDASDDPDATEAAVADLKNCRVIRQTKRTGQAGARNVGLRASATTYALLLDDDAHPDNPEALVVFLDDCHAAIHIDPQAAEAYNNRGLVYQKMNALEKAGDDYLKACSLGLETACTNYLEVNQP